MTASSGDVDLGFAESFDRGLAGGFVAGLSWVKELPEDKSKMETTTRHFENRMVSDLST
jgi:hypothetical protein